MLPHHIINRIGYFPIPLLLILRQDLTNLPQVDLELILKCRLALDLLSTCLGVSGSWNDRRGAQGLDNTVIFLISLRFISKHPEFNFELSVRTGITGGVRLGNKSCSFSSILHSHFSSFPMASGLTSSLGMPLFPFCLWLGLFVM